MTDSLGYVMYMHVIEAIQGKGSILLEVVDHVIDRSMWKSITEAIGENQGPIILAIFFWVLTVIVAIYIDLQSVLDIFLKDNRPGSSNKMKGYGWSLFRIMNWFISWTFTASLMILACSTKGSSLQIDESNRGYLMAIFISLSYLCACFGVTITFKDINQTPRIERGSNTTSRLPRSSTGLLKLVPVAYFISLILVVLRLDATQAIQFLVAFTGIFVCIASVCVLNRAPDLPDVVRSMLQFVCLGALFVGFLLVLQEAPNAHLGSSTVLKEGFRAFLFVMLGIFVHQFMPASTAPTQPLMQVDDEARLRRNYPPPYPNGWYVLFDADEVQIGEVKPVHALGQEFVVFRGENGKASVLDAYCPHMGAHLGCGGQVDGNDVVCPFHHWKFNGSGECSHIPYSDKIPSTARTKAWPTREYHGMICIYFDADGREPPYELRNVEEVTSGDFYYCGTADRVLNMHLIEFVENSADFQHFDCLHNNMVLPFTQIMIPGITIKHDPSFETDEHVVTFTDNASLMFCGYNIPRTSATAIVTIMGPGSTNFFRFKTELGDVLLFHMHTPVSPLKQKVRFRWYAAKSVPKALAWYVVGTWISQVEADREVWENKRYLRKPLVVKEDGPLLKVRRWYNQFYSENSRNIVQGRLDW